MEKIIKKINEIRNRKGFSYENMAHDLDLSVSAYRKIETGETKLTVERLVDISKILETPLDEFLDVNSQKNFNQEIKEQSKAKTLSRFISTHPDEDHFGGIHWLDDVKPIQN